MSVPGHSADPWLRHLVLLTCLSTVVFLVGPTTQGVAGWHEGQRLLVARQMLDSGEWLVPRLYGTPYLAKPPMVYWCQMASALARGDRVELLDTRLTMGVFALLGVLATYMAGRELFRACPEGCGADGRAAFWAAAFLGTGLEYARLARLGQVDMLLAAPTAVGVWTLARCVRYARAGRGTPWATVAAGSLAAAMLALTKGPPALVPLLVCALGGGIAMGLPSTGPVWPRRVGTVVGGLAAGAAAFSQLDGQWLRSGGVVGAVLAAALGGGVGWILGSLASVGGVVGVLRWLWGSRVLVLMAIGTAAFATWGAGVRAEVGSQLAAAWVAHEAEENLVLGWPQAPLQNLGTALYGAGFGSIAALVGLWQLGRDTMRARRDRGDHAPPARPLPGLAILVGWCLGGLIVFSLVGRGSSRYLLPILPAVALAGGYVVARAHPGALIVRIAPYAVGCLAIGLSAWFGFGRAIVQTRDTPRHFVRDLLAPDRGVRTDRLGAFEMFWPALDYYADHAIQPVGGVPSHLTGIPPITLRQLRRDIRRTGEPYTLLVRLQEVGGLSPVERLGAAGLRAERIEIGHEWLLDGTPVGAFRVRLGPRPVPSEGARPLAPGTDPPVPGA